MSGKFKASSSIMNIFGADTQRHGEPMPPSHGSSSTVIEDEAQSITYLVLLLNSSEPPRAIMTQLKFRPLSFAVQVTDYKSGWITVSEYNYDVLERSYNFDPNQNRAAISAAYS